jgi:hypothetical protein
MEKKFTFLFVICILIMRGFVATFTAAVSGSLLLVAACTDAWIINSQKTMSSGFPWILLASSTNVVTTATTEIIGSGRIGSFLAEAGNCKVLGRNDKIDPDREGNPIFIATRNDALESIIENCPENRLSDLVFLQNGYLDNFLKSKNLLNNTQVLLYLSVPAKGVTPVDGVTTYNPEGLTAATGRHAATFGNRLASLQMKCRIVSPSDYRPAMFEKLM